MNKNIILAALILVVIFLISQRQTENFRIVRPDLDGNNRECDGVNTKDDCKNPYFRVVCRDKCDSINGKLDKNKEDFGWRDDTCNSPATRWWAKVLAGCYFR